MKFILGTVISLFSFFMLYFFVAIFSPDFYEVEKTQDFSQSRQIVWHKFSGFRNWESWLPWKSQSDTIHYTYSGVSGRAGAKVAWHSQEFGSGSRMVTRIEPFVELEYVLRLKERNSVTKNIIRLSDNESGTTVSWKSRGTLSFWERPLGTLGILQSQIGADFEKGLKSIERELNFN
jgi:hypothetical protein